ncbi:terpene cyclase [Aspergillus pseudoviridinutans]|uniref:Terpene synthase n=1 Tax=Aspergillus pseudoviridinutans TaxID=1517512 RepID=A0A9P3EVA7_9EURO|nr:terpene cyclase [Aspergillus pseudoviridinutans]GIJ89486.1 terpene cyclase [Aspergillus pseudoviridinutans]
MIEESSLRLWKRNLAHPRVWVPEIRLKEYGTSLEFLLPDYELECVPTENGPQNGGTTHLSKALEAEVELKLSLQPQLHRPHIDLYKAAISQVQAVSLLFPDCHADSVCICMTAWVGTLCTVDDMLEDMKPLEAEAALQEIISVLEEKGGRKYTAARGDAKYVYHTHGSLGTYTTSRSTVAVMVAKFKAHCEKYLPTALSHAVFRDLSETFQGMQQEMQLKRGSLPYDLDTYMSIRTRTIGIKPLFTLALSTWRQDHIWSSTLDNIQNEVNMVAGLQNDLIGLEKDLRKGEQANAVIILMGKHYDQHLDREDLQKVTKYLCERHNLAISRLIKQMEDLRRSAHLQDRDQVLEMVLLDMQLLFSLTHFQWCTSAKRYKGD